MITFYTAPLLLMAFNFLENRRKAHLQATIQDVHDFADLVLIIEEATRPKPISFQTKRRKAA